MKVSPSESAHEYARAVVDGQIDVCKWVKLACERHLSHLELAANDPEFPYIFDHSKANRAAKFIELLPHVKGRWAARKQRIKLQSWQHFIVCSIFGWVHRDSGKRKYRQAYICVPRKNGKSPLAAGIALYMFLCDGEAGAEVYCGAVTEKQALEVFRPARQMVQRTPALQEAFSVKIGAKTLSVPANGSRFEPVIGRPGDGASVSCGIADEFHEADTADLVDTFTTGMVGREQPLLLVITTAGFNTASPCHDLQVEVQKVLEGSVEDERTFAVIYTIDANDDWTSPSVLRKANPNLGVSVDEATLIHDQRMAAQNSAKQNVFKTKHLCVWCNANVAWLNMAAWAKCKDVSLNEEDFASDPCYIGIDLASSIDLSSVAKLYIRWIDGKPHYYIFSRHYLPEERIHLPENQHYQRWFHDGALIATEGAAIDYSVIRGDLLNDVQTSTIREVCYDKAYAGATMQELAAECGVETVEIPQRVQYLSPAMKAFEAAVLDDRVHHNGDPVLTWAMSNVVAREDANANVFPRKQKNELKIDPAVAVINAMARAATAPEVLKTGWFQPFTI